MARILIAWELGGGLGHCAMLEPIASRLIARGHEVYFAARDLVTAHRACGNIPVKLLPAPYSAGPPSTPVINTTTLAHILHNTGFGDRSELTALVSSWLNLFDFVQPAAVLCEHAPVALLASRCRDLRRMAIGYGFTLPPDVSPLPAMRPDGPHDQLSAARCEQQALERVNEQLIREAGRPLERLSQLYSETNAQFLLTFKELDHHPQRGVADFRGLWSPAGGDPPSWPIGAGPRVFAYLKASAAPWRVELLLALLRELPIRAVAYIGDAGGDLLKLQSSALTISPRRLDAAAVAAQCDLAILHGTVGATTQFLRAGVPVLSLPLYFEQGIMAQRVANLGAGLTADPRRIENIAARLWTLLADPRYRDAAQAFAVRYSGYDGLAEQDAIATRIHQLLEQ